MKLNIITILIANTKNYLQSGWVKAVQYWSYLYSVFDICTLLLYKKNQHSVSVAEKHKCIH